MQGVPEYSPQLKIVIESKSKVSQNTQMKIVIESKSEVSQNNPPKWKLS